MQELDLRLKKIEQKLNNIEKILLNFSPPKTIQSAPIRDKPPPLPIEEPINELPCEQLEFQRINSHLQRWPTLLGILLILLSLCWSFYYVYSQRLLNASTTLIIGLMINITLMSCGTYLMPKRKLGGEILINLGTAGGILCLWFAHIHYHLISSDLSLLAMISILFTTIGIALKLHNKSLAFSASFWAMLVPILIGENYFDYSKLMSYVLVVDCAALLGFFLRGWSSPLLLSCTATYLFQYRHLGSSKITFLALFFFLFYAGWSTLIFSSKQKEGSSWIHLVAISIISILSTMFQLIAYSSLKTTSTALMVLSIILFGSFYKLIKSNAPTGARKILSLVLPLFAFLCILNVTRIEFENPLRNLMIFGEIWAAILIANYIFNAPRPAHYLSILFIIPYNEYFFFMDDHVYSGNLLIAVLTMGSTLWIIGSDKESEKFSLSTFIFCLIGYFFMQCMWHLSLSIIPSEDLARGVTLIFFTLIGVLALGFGPTTCLRKGGVALIIFVALRLILIEIWEMTLPNRIITFLLVGIMLILIGFGKKKTPNIENEAS